jgi:hypothetical protein
MFDDTQTTVIDRMSIAVTDIEEWLEENGYDIAEAIRSGEFRWEDPGYSVGAENDAITIGYLAGKGEDPVIHTYMLEELWAMDEDEFKLEIDEMASEA